LNADQGLLHRMYTEDCFEFIFQCLNLDENSIVIENAVNVIRVLFMAKHDEELNPWVERL